jgi:carboxylesterase type B
MVCSKSPVVPRPSYSQRNTAWTKDPIVNAFIPESGTASLSPGGAGDKSANWFKASQRLGCGGTEAGEKALDCMRTKPWKDVLKAIKPEGATADLGGMGDFGPIADNKVVFSDYKARNAAGNFIKRPMLVGNNANEIALFAVILGQNSMLSSPMLKAAGGAFGCPSGSAAKARADNKVKSWRYLYAAEWPNQIIAPGAGAWHGSEIGSVFGSTEYQQQFYGKMTGQNISMPDTPEQAKLQKTMMTAWAEFAKDPENALEKLGWPVYDPASKF